MISTFTHAAALLALTALAGCAVPAAPQQPVEAPVSRVQQVQAQTGFAITRPPTPVGRARITSLFGDSEANEGSIAVVTSGRISTADAAIMFISEAKE